MIQMRKGLIVKSIWNGILGIASEVLMVFLFVVSAFIICLLWWSCVK
ncbi:MAG: hypothetical protein JXB40_01600 [Candidatus Omnitrophica bacterium]|nr:hypothetical protein [Candidatus Omnitrophota bacterium]